MQPRSLLSTDGGTDLGQAHFSIRTRYAVATLKFDADARTARPYTLLATIGAYSDLGCIALACPSQRQKTVYIRFGERVS